MRRAVGATICPEVLPPCPWSTAPSSPCSLCSRDLTLSLSPHLRRGPLTLALGQPSSPIRHSSTQGHSCYNAQLGGNRMNITSKLKTPFENLTASLLCHLPEPQPGSLRPPTSPGQWTGADRPLLGPPQSRVSDAAPVLCTAPPRTPSSQDTLPAPRMPSRTQDALLPGCPPPRTPSSQDALPPPRMPCAQGCCSDDSPSSFPTSLDSFL